MPFVTPLEVQEEFNNHWVLTSDLKYEGKYDPFIVPAGFRTNFASVPRLFTWLVPTSGTYTKAAVLHDWLCSQSSLSRYDADGIFRRTLRELGVSDLRRYVMWGAVRLAAGMKGCSVPEWLLIIGLALLVLPAALPGALIVLAGLSVMFVFELVLWGAGRLIGRKVSKPQHFWWT